MLAEKFDLHVYNSSKFYKKEERKKTWKKATLHYIPFNANGMQSIIYDIISMIHALFYADVLLVLGVSGGIFIPFVRIFTNKKIIVNIDGLEWRREKWNKYAKKFLKLSEFLSVKFSHADITDNASIKRYAAIYYKTLSHQIEYGADHTSGRKMTSSLLKEFPFLRNPYAFKVARIEPENNIHLILEAFSRIPSKQLVVIGNWQASSYGSKLREAYNRFDHIHLLDPIYDQAKLDMIRSNCFVYIHGHSAGGTNPSLVEAMYLGLPVLAYRVSYNQATTEEQAFFFSNADDLEELLTSRQLKDYKSLGEKMKSIARRRYVWSVIADRVCKNHPEFRLPVHKEKYHTCR